jgi:hypothetical protein
MASSRDCESGRIISAKLNIHADSRSICASFTCLENAHLPPNTSSAYGSQRCLSGDKTPVSSSIEIRIDPRDDQTRWRRHLAGSHMTGYEHMSSNLRRRSRKWVRRVKCTCRRARSTCVRGVNCNDLIIARQWMLIQRDTTRLPISHKVMTLP